MMFLTARISPTANEDGRKQAYAAIEMAEYEIMELRNDKVCQLERGVSLYMAKNLIEDIAVLDGALKAISSKRKEK